MPDINHDYKIVQLSFIEIKSATPYSDDVISNIEAIPGVANVCYLRPVLPVLSRKELEVPFTFCHEMIALGQSENLSLWELAMRYESARGGISEKLVFDQMRTIVRIMQGGIEEGLQGTYYEDRILPVQALGFK